MLANLSGKSVLFCFLLSTIGCSKRTILTSKSSQSVLTNFKNKSPKIELVSNILACKLELNEAEKIELATFALTFEINNTTTSKTIASSKKIASYVHEAPVQRVSERTDDIKDVLVGDMVTCTIRIDLQDDLISSVTSEQLVIHDLGQSNGSPAFAADVLSGHVFWDSSGKSMYGSMTNRGTWSLTGQSSGFSGSGYFEGVSNAPSSTTICSGTTIVGISGAAICQTGTPTGGDPAASEIFSGKSAWKSDGTIVNGTLVNRGAIDIASVFPGAGYYSAISASPTNSTICTGTTLLGISGNATCQGVSGGTNAAASEVLSGKYFWNSA